MNKSNKIYIYIYMFMSLPHLLFNIIHLQISQSQPVQQQNLDRLYILVVGCSLFVRLQHWAHSNVTLALEDAGQQL